MGMGGSPSRPIAPDAVDDDAGEDEDHGGDTRQVGEVLLRAEPDPVVMGGRGQVYEHVEREGDDGHCHADMDQAGHAPHVSSEPAEPFYH
jgi:hypothetical protein